MTILHNRQDAKSYMIRILTESYNRYITVL